MPNITESVAAEVRAVAARANITNAQIAETLGLSRVSVSKRMNGKVPFTVAELGLVADLAGTDLKEFFRGVTSPTRAA